MDRFHFIILLLAICFAASACGESNAQRSEAIPTPGPAGTNSKALKGGNSDVSTDPTPANINSGVPRVNASVQTVINSNINARVSDSGTANVDVRSGKGIERDLPRRRERIDADPSAMPPPPTFQKAPENSEFAVQMEPGGNVVETRVFKSHAQIRKAEIRWTDPQTRSLKLTLKSGKILERQKVPNLNLRTVPSAELLKLAGRAVQ